jgi:PAS domain S-box-containing protein
VTLVDTEATITYVSRRTTHLHGYDDPADLVGVSAFDLVAPHARERTRQVFVRMLSAGILRESRFPLLRADGSTFLGELSAASLRDAAGRPRGAIAITRDISARERAAAELAQSQALLQASELLYRTLVEASRDGILLADAEGRIVKCNERFAVMHGYPAAAGLTGLSLFELCADRERAHETWDGLFTGDGARHLQHTSLRRDGTTFPSDVTTRVEAEVRLRDYQTHLRSLTAELSLAEERERRRIGMGLHDSVGQMLVFCGLRLGALAGDDLPEEVTTALDEVRGQLSRAVEHTRTLIFELSSPVLYELGFEAAVRSDTERFARESGIAFRFVDDGAPKPMADDVAVTLYQSVRELMTNAVKHAQAANVLVTVTRVDDRACVSVDDDGCGFFPSGADPAADPRRGYGLSSIRERIDHVGGEVTIESSRGHGTRVELRAPLQGA